MLPGYIVEYWPYVSLSCILNCHKVNTYFFVLSGNQKIFEINYGYYKNSRYNNPL